MFVADPGVCFGTDLRDGRWSFVATRETQTHWPLADGVLYGERTDGHKVEVAVELKRHQEGIHGVLTALGQGHAYRDKGFDGSILVIPSAYPTLAEPGARLRRIVECTSPAQPIGIACYDEPDPGQVSPFKDRLRVVRPVGITEVFPDQRGRPRVSDAQWTHLREGSFDPDIFYRYLQVARLATLRDMGEPHSPLPEPLEGACREISPDLAPHKYLSRTPGDSWHDVVWRHFWFDWVFVEGSRQIWTDPYQPDHTCSRLRRWDGGGYKLFFSGRSDSIKPRLCRRLESGDLTKAAAWIEFAKNVHRRAHSLREDIDSPLEYMGMVDETGRPTALAREWLEICDRTGDPSRGMAVAWLVALFLQRGRLDAFIHYVFRLSEARFSRDAAEFTSGGRFDSSAYRAWLHSEMASSLCVIRTSAERGGQTRGPFQAELAFLSAAGLIPRQRRYRQSVGLLIDWPAVQQLRDIKFPND